jgi:replicative DNA helicase
MSDDPGSPMALLTNGDLEECVLGQIVVHGAWQLYASLGIQQAHFWSPERRKLIRIAAKLVADGVSPDAVLLRQGGGSAMAISQCMDNTVRVNEENAKWMLDQLRELSRARRIYHEAQNLEQRLAEGGSSAPAIVAKHLEAVEDIVRESSGGGIVMNADAQHAAAATLAKERTSSRRVWLGLRELDKVINGLSSGEVLGLAARPGIGKTLWMGRYMRSVMDYEIPALMFSLEMPTAQIVTRLVQPEWKMTRTKALDAISSSTLTAERYRETFSRLHICDRAGLSVAEMEAMTMRVKAQHDIGLVLIDHLGLVGGHNDLRPYERTSYNSREIKDLAKRCEVPVVLALQVSRDAGGDGSTPLSLSSTRDSGVTEEVVDYLVGLHRPERGDSLTATQRFDFQDVVMARVLKNRHGAVGGEAAVHIDPETLVWTERADLRSPTGGRRRSSSS